MKLVSSLRDDNIHDESTPVRDLVDQLREQRGTEAVAGCLSAAAALVEHAAYEMAQQKTATHVAQMILLAADLERTAQNFDGASH